MLEFALQYAARGWRIFPAHSINLASGQCTCGKPGCKDVAKHPRIKAWQRHASADPAVVERWWRRWPDANIAVVCGNGKLVGDIDSQEGLDELRGLCATHGPIGETLTAQSGRDGLGLHLYLAGDLKGSRQVGRILWRGARSYVIAPPSWHKSGRRYKWLNPQTQILSWPDWLRDHIGKSQQATDENVGFLIGPRPDYLGPLDKRLAAELYKSLGLQPNPDELERIQEALACVPAGCPRELWLHIGMALHSLAWELPDGTNLGFQLWDRWSAGPDGKEEKYSLDACEKAWASFRRSGIGIGTLFHIAREQSGNSGERKLDSVFQPQNSGETPTINGADFAGLAAMVPSGNDAIEWLNSRHCVINNLGGKCVVMGSAPSPLDPTRFIPSFQTFDTFKNVYCNQFQLVRVGKRVEREPLGHYWLEHPKRRTYESLALVPRAEAVLPGNILNLWHGFAVKPAAGSWDLLKRHIFEVLASQNQKSFAYILKWTAWTLQHPEARAQVALVLRGGEGVGKGTFFRALQKIFGHHSLHIHNSKHLVGNFNAVLRDCILLYADEAFWAGDKQGESTLKGLLSDPELMIEQKGFDAIQWVNLLHVIIGANSEWVVPAKHDARRYAVHDVASARVGDKAYFDALYHEIENGGAAAMLHDLLAVDLKEWHPNQIVRTAALQEQKELTLTPLEEWYLEILETGHLPGYDPEKAKKDGKYNCAPSALLFHNASNQGGFYKGRPLTQTALGRFLRKMGCELSRGDKRNSWYFNTLLCARERWRKRFHEWEWQSNLEEWENNT